MPSVEIISADISKHDTISFMDTKDFLWFIEERESIRLKKEAGLPRPWTVDHILDKCHFLNIHTKDDAGTKRLHKYIEGMEDWTKLFYIFFYRSAYSSKKLLDEMTGVWIHDIRNIRFLNIGLDFEYKPYIYYAGKHKSLKSFLFDVTYSVLQLFWQSFCRLQNATILDVEDELSVLFMLQTGRGVGPLSSIIANDIALQFPETVNPESKCRISIAIKYMLKKIERNNRDQKIENLRHSNGLNYSSLNRALREWYKYTKRKEYFEERGCLREGWLI